ncbi:hypothetical protein PIB30_109894, partial [Stylosanthes scabra]|nr:hypothetical protein [Stylosanthes scabra]
MSKFGSFTVPEAESFLQAYDEMMQCNKTLGQTLPTANLVQSYYPPYQRGDALKSFRKSGRPPASAPDRI